MTWIIYKVNRIPTHCGVEYELARGHVIKVCDSVAQTDVYTRIKSELVSDNKYMKPQLEVPKNTE